MNFSHVSKLFIFGALMLTARPASASGTGSPASRQQAAMADSLPQRWVMNEHFIQDVPTDDHWWKSFGDTTLNTLIEMGVDNNFNVLEAARRMEVARLSLLKTRAGYLPTLGLDAAWTKSRSSGALTSPTRPASTDSYFTLGLSMNWQIDVFGRIAQASKAGKAQWQASRADYAATMVTLCGNIATAYVQLRVYQAEQAVAVAHLASQAKVLDITKARFEAGIASMLDVQQATTVYASTQASIPALETAIHRTINSLAVLLAVTPDEAARLLGSYGPIPPYLQMVQTGIPMDLLRRRPDVVEAEQNLAAMAAEVGIAKKDFLPTLSLNASIGTAAHDAGDLFTSRSFTWSVAPTLSWTVFDAMQRRYNVATAKENMQVAIDAYNLIIIQALTEADNAMAAYLDTLRRIESLRQAAQASEKSLDLSLDLYKRGLAAFTNVVDAQMNFLTYTNNLLVAQGDAVIDLVDLYEALGGGWQGITDK